MCNLSSCESIFRRNHQFLIAALAPMFFLSKMFLTVLEETVLNTLNKTDLRKKISCEENFVLQKWLNQYGNFFYDALKKKS